MGVLRGGCVRGGSVLRACVGVVVVCGVRVLVCCVGAVRDVVSQLHLARDNPKYIGAWCGGGGGSGWGCCVAVVCVAVVCCGSAWCGGSVLHACVGTLRFVALRWVCCEACTGALHCVRCVRCVALAHADRMPDSCIMDLLLCLCVCVCMHVYVCVCVCVCVCMRVHDYVCLGV